MKQADLRSDFLLKDVWEEGGQTAKKATEVQLCLLPEQSSK